MKNEPYHRTKTPDTYHYKGKRITIREAAKLTGVPIKRIQADCLKGYTIAYIEERYRQQKINEAYIKLHKTKCQHCLYGSSHGGNKSISSQECMYLLDTGKRRKHHGLGTCDSYEKGTRTRRTPLEVLA